MTLGCFLQFCLHLNFCNSVRLNWLAREYMGSGCLHTTCVTDKVLLHLAFFHVGSGDLNLVPHTFTVFTR